MARTSLPPTALDELAARYGIATSYIDMDGRVALVPDATKRGLLAAMGVDARTPAAARRALGGAPPIPPVIAREELDDIRCFTPEWLADTRVWGVALQVYQLRSSRNFGIGDFADLAAVAIELGKAGADFVGTNPLHALFLADPQRASPFAPSSRSALNPLAIAVDWVDGFEDAMVDRDALAAVRASTFVDYDAVAALKLTVLRAIWPKWRERDAAIDPAELTALHDFRVDPHRAPEGHALFEAISAAMVADGRGAGWPSWPEPFQDRGSPEVAAFSEAHRDDVDFHLWLQFLAVRQLALVAETARDAGMRIGLYLDLAVGTAPDGSATWADPKVVLGGVRIGAPPDFFSVDGQDWGLASLSPAGLAERGFVPYRDMLAAVMRYAGAIRIDHAMGLERLYLIPDGATAADGAYVAMPLRAMLETLAETSRDARCLVIGEDLGVVRAGFRELMERAGIQSYRILAFERDANGLKPPEAYPSAALACLSTHDMPPLKGWWRGDEIALRLDLGRIDEAHAATEREARAADRAAFLTVLSERGLITDTERRGAAEGELTAPVAAAMHRFGAETASRLFAVRLEDLMGERDLVNLPGTDREHPNWRRKLAIPIEDFAHEGLFGPIVAAVAAERPKP